MHHGDVSPAIAAGLLALKKRIDAAKIPSSKLDETINLAVWNIREFGKSPRTEPAIHYIGEILGQFDLVALVELRSNLKDLGRVLPILGPSWDVVYTDWMPDAVVTANGSPSCSTGEPRRSTVWRPRLTRRAPSKEASFSRRSRSGGRRTMCSFRSGNFDFIAIATHARWGTGTDGRKAEIQMLADWIDQRFNDEFVEDHDLIVAGDFNVPKIGDDLFKALTSRGLMMPDALKDLKAGDQAIGGSNIAENARFDQILHLPSMKSRFSNVGGVLDFYGSDAKIKELFPTQNYTREKFTFQLSDHFPVWVQVKTDIDGDRLTEIVQDSKS